MYASVRTPSISCTFHITFSSLGKCQQCPSGSDSKQIKQINCRAFYRNSVALEPHTCNNESVVALMKYCIPNCFYIIECKDLRHPSSQLRHIGLTLNLFYSCLIVH
ncbi:hypothetical protein M758_UG033400 [Ceratodon purpureus]|nr:hypothetical protein M758_UG033400 [Ceratodon purpureus]